MYTKETATESVDIIDKGKLAIDGQNYYFLQPHRI